MAREYQENLVTPINMTCYLCNESLGSSLCNYCKSQFPFHDLDDEAFKIVLYEFQHGTISRGGSRGKVQGVRTPPEMTGGFLIQLVFCKTMWFIGVEVEQETVHPLLKKILDPPLISYDADHHEHFFLIQFLTNILP